MNYLEPIEKLRYEAQSNGNANWDSGFEYFCNYIWDILSSWGKFEKKTLKEIRDDLDRLLKEDDPYLKEDLFDRLTDHIIEWYLDNKEPIKNEKKLNLHR